MTPEQHDDDDDRGNDLAAHELAKADAANASLLD